MNRVYKLTGMTCGGCEASVKRSLQEVSGVNVIEVSREKEEVSIDIDTSVTIAQLRTALLAYSEKYSISELQPESTYRKMEVELVDERTWLATYKPILLIFGYIAGVTLLIQLSSDSINYTTWMRHFMAGFFLVISFFKLLNLRGFASSYAMYDVVARKIPAWGYTYVLVELGLGLAYLMNYNPVVTNTVALLVMSVSIIGVLKSVLNKQTIQCACLGDVFNLPMSTVTIIEDGLMIVMSGFMLMNAI